VYAHDKGYLVTLPCAYARQRRLTWHALRMVATGPLRTAKAKAHDKAAVHGKGWRHGKGEGARQRLGAWQRGLAHGKERSHGKGILICRAVVIIRFYVH
jgi:hypothetical protein